MTKIIDLSPYRFKTGRRAGQVVDVLALTNYKELFDYLGLLNKLDRHRRGKNEFHRYLEWLISRARVIQPTAICPHCGQDAMKYVVLKSFFGFFELEFSQLAFSCASQACKTQAKFHGKSSDLRKISFALYQARPRPTRQYLVTEVISKDLADKILKQAFNIPDQLSEIWAINFFRSPQSLAKT